MTPKRIPGSGNYGLQTTALDERQGKCSGCKIIFRWPSKNGLLRRAICPDCGRPLSRTSHLKQWPRKWVERVPHKSRLAS